MGRIFARELGCTKNDIYEIDAASNRSIDDIRALRGAVQTRPLESPYKVYIIDEVHMLTKDAFNALLKTLEEPPQHVIFILATTELHKVLDTVISRCQVFRFNTPSQATLVAMLQKVAQQEGRTLAEDAAEIMGLLSDGSFRDAQGVLQKVLSAVSSKEITRDIVEPIIGVPQDELVEKFVRACADQDTDMMLHIVQKIKEQSYGVSVFLLLVLRKVRLILSLRYGASLRDEMKKELSEREYNFAISLIGTEGAVLNAGFLSQLIQALQQSKFASVEGLPLEMFVFTQAEKPGGVEKKQEIR